jgi:hypothetical protein
MFILSLLIRKWGSILALDQAKEDETLEQLEPLDQDKSGLEGLHKMQKKIGRQSKEGKISFSSTTNGDKKSDT